MAMLDRTAATFSVAAFGTPALQFQWQRSDDGGTTWDVPATGTGATSASYTTASTSVGGDNGARFRVIIDSPEGATTSNVVTLTVGDELSGQIAQYVAGEAYDDQGNVVAAESLVAADADGNVAAAEEIVVGTVADDDEAAS